jgi:flagellar basal-body rod protein FlgG
MIKGLYRSASAMMPRIKKQEVIANNLANASSPGFKKDVVFTKELSRAEKKLAPRRTDWQTPMIDQVYTSYDQGGFDKTGNPLDLAIEGEGFFVFETPGGEVISRAGNLTISPEGFIVNMDGHRLLSEGGALNVGTGEVSISEAGQVEVNGEAVGSIRIVDVENRDILRKAGRTEFILPPGVEAIPVINFAIKQGYLESSNVNIINEMVEMITTYRNFEADSKSIQAQDESLEKLFNNVGRIK